MKQILVMIAAVALVALVALVGCAENAVPDGGSGVCCVGVTAIVIGLFIYGIWWEDDGTKQCPFCKEYINSGASVCPKCTKEQ